MGLGLWLVLVLLLILVLVLPVVELMQHVVVELIKTIRVYGAQGLSLPCIDGLCRSRRC